MGGPLFSMTVEGRPIPKARPRAAITPQGKIGVYSQKSTRAYELQLAQTAKVLWRGQGRFEPLPGPLRMTVSVVLAKPLRRSLEWPVVPSTRNGDLDNYVKTAQDALNGVVFYDDAQIVSLIANKYYGEPCLRIEVDRI